MWYSLKFLILIRNCIRQTTIINQLSIVNSLEWWMDRFHCYSFHFQVCCPAEDQNETAPLVSLVTKHDNGTLNLWQITFADKSKFSQVLSIGHKSRASGHRFRVNDITCHPVLPLLLTTSHHNIVDQKSHTNDRVVSIFYILNVNCYFLYGNWHFFNCQLSIL